MKDCLQRDPGLLSCRDENGSTALHHAAFHGHRDLVRLLAEAGLSINSLDDEFGATPAGWAIEYLRQLGGVLAIEIDDLIFAIQRGDQAWVARLVQRHPTLRDQVDEQGTSVLEHARRSGDAGIIDLMSQRNP